MGKLINKITLKIGKWYLGLLKNNIDELKMRNEILEEEVKQLKIDNKALQKHNDKLFKVIGSLNNEIETLDEIIQRGDIDQGIDMRELAQNTYGD